MVKPRSSRNLIAQKWRCKSAQLDCESRKECDVAKSAEIQSWLRREAVTAAIWSQYHHRDIMRRRGVLRYKASCKAKSRLKNHWLPLLVRKFQPKHLWRHDVEAVSSSWLTISYPLRKDTSRTRFFRGRLTMCHLVSLLPNQFPSCAKR